MSSQSPAIDGANITRCRSFKLAFNGSAGASASATIDAGAYALLADADVIVVLGGSGVAATALPTSQPAAASPNGLLVVPAGVPTPLDVPAAGLYLAALGSTTTAGTLKVSGPLAHSTVRG